MNKIPDKFDLIIITGPTATGKTKFAAYFANKLNAEIISADSRQVYKKMNIGTGKDIEDYEVNGIKIPYHLVDIQEPGSKYNIYEFQQDFLDSYKAIKERNKNVILCGGTGMYIESIIKGYKLINVPVNKKMRVFWEKQSDDELIALLSTHKTLHNISDTSTRKRLIRAIEIGHYYQTHDVDVNDFPKLKSFILGINFDRAQIRKRITARLKHRIENGMIEEIEALLNSGISSDDLIYYGLEYKYITLYLLQEISYDEMFTKLNTAIHQFAKRQMTWFRRMERQGMKINWLDGYASMNEKIERALFLME